MAHIIFYLNKAGVLDDEKIAILLSLSQNSLHIKHLARVIERLDSAKRLSTELFDFLVEPRNSFFLENVALYETLTLFSENDVQLTSGLWDGLFIHNPEMNLHFHARINQFLAITKQFPVDHHDSHSESNDESDEQIAKMQFFTAILAPENTNLLINETLLPFIQTPNFRKLAIHHARIFRFMENLWDELLNVMRDQFENAELILDNYLVLHNGASRNFHAHTEDYLAVIFSAENVLILTRTDFNNFGFTEQLSRIPGAKLTLDVWRDLLNCCKETALDPEVMLGDYLRSILGNHMNTQESVNSEHIKNINIIKKYLGDTGILTRTNEDEISGQIIDPDNTVLFTTISENGQSVASQLSLIPKDKFKQKHWDELLECCEQAAKEDGENFNQLFSVYMQQFIEVNAHQKRGTQKRSLLDSSTEESKEGLEDTLEKHFLCLKSMIEQAVKEAKASKKSDSQSAQASSLNATSSMYHNRASYPKIDALYKLLQDTNNFLPVITWLKNDENLKELSRGLFGTYFQQQFSEASEENPFNCHNLEELTDCMERYGNSKSSTQICEKKSSEEYKSYSR